MKQNAAITVDLKGLPEVSKTEVEVTKETNSKIAELQKEALERIYTASTCDLFTQCTTEEEFNRMLMACVKDCKRISKTALSLSHKL